MPCGLPAVPQVIAFLPFTWTHRRKKLKALAHVNGQAKQKSSVRVELVGRRAAVQRRYTAAEIKGATWAIGLRMPMVEAVPGNVSPKPELMGGVGPSEISGVGEVFVIQNLRQPVVAVAVDFKAGNRKTRQAALAKFRPVGARNAKHIEAVIGSHVRPEHRNRVAAEG